MHTIDLVYLNAGGGHRAAAVALQDAIARQGLPWLVRLVDLARIIDPDGQFRRVMGFDPEQYYNKRLQRGWTLGLSQELKVLQGAIRLAHGPLLKRLTRHWAATEPDLVVSLIPNFNRVLSESMAGALPGVPFTVVITDMADHPPQFWIDPAAHQTIVCGTARAMAQARAAGHPDARLVATSGMVIKPSFYDLPPLDRAAGRLALGLDPVRPTAVVMFGGQGSRQMLRIARTLGDLQLILLCGRDSALKATLDRLRRPAPHAALGFRDDVERVMRLADFFIGKPGPGCLSEAVQLGLPVVALRNTWTLPQERYNAEWVRERGVGLAVSSVSQLPRAAQETLRRLPELRAATAAVRNRAVFEIVALLRSQLARSAMPEPGPMPDFGAALALR